MKKVSMILAAFCLAEVSSAQDVIVKKDGSTILSKVLEVNTSDIKYKKFSNQNGPTYTINKSEIMSINYENGDKDTFNDVSSPAVTAPNVPSPAPAVDYAALAKENLPLVKEFNSHDVVYLNDDTDKKAGGIICSLGIKDGSIIETPELKASFSMKAKYMVYTFSSGRVKRSRITEITDNMQGAEDSWLDMMVVTLKNKTDKPIYIDLGTSYFIAGEESTPYYIPTATTTSSGNASGGSVNMGAVAGALGVGGALGTLAGGVNMGGGSSTSTSTTTYSQRVISIPPMASVSLEPQSIGRGHIFEAVGRHKFYRNVEMSCYDYFKDKGQIVKKKNCDEIHFDGLKRGEKIDIPQMENVTPLSVHLSYAFDEMISQPLNMRIDFYWRQILGVKLWSSDLWGTIDYRKCPLIFLAGNPIGVNYR